MKKINSLTSHFSRLTSIAAMAIVTMTMLTACEDSDDYIAQQLRAGDWQGYISTYYSDRWGLSGDDYATVMQFTSAGAYYTSGRGRELDYNTRSPRNDYAYCTFKWFIVDGEITLIYDDAKWNPLYIVNYGLNSTNFWGYIYDGTNTRIRFDLENIAYDGWGYYGSGNRGGYGDFSNQNWFRSREIGANASERLNADSLPFIDNTPMLKQENPDAECVMSGEFARAYENMK